MTNAVIMSITVIGVIVEVFTMLKISLKIANYESMISDLTKYIKFENPYDMMKKCERIILRKDIRKLKTVFGIVTTIWIVNLIMTNLWMLECLTNGL